MSNEAFEYSLRKSGFLAYGCVLVSKFVKEIKFAQMGLKYFIHVLKAHAVFGGAGHKRQ